MRLWRMYGLLCAVLFFAVSQATAQDISRLDALSLFVKANELYKEESFDEAIRIYEEIIAQGKTSGAIYYNLANSYYHAGQLGQAILNYERAKRLMPRDGDLSYNYRYARSRAAFFEGEIGKGWLHRAINDHLNFYSLDEMAIAILLLLWAMLVGHLISIAQSWPRGRKMICAASLAVLFVIFTGGFFLKWQVQSGKAVLLQPAVANFEPREGATTHYQLNEGAKVTIIKEEDDWMKVRREDGKMGWVKKAVIEAI